MYENEKVGEEPTDRSVAAPCGEAQGAAQRIPLDQLGFDAEALKAIEELGWRVVVFWVPRAAAYLGYFETTTGRRVPDPHGTDQATAEELMLLTRRLAAYAIRSHAGRRRIDTSWIR